MGQQAGEKGESSSSSALSFCLLLRLKCSRAWRWGGGTLYIGVTLGLALALAYWLMRQEPSHTSSARQDLEKREQVLGPPLPYWGQRHAVTLALVKCNNLCYNHPASLVNLNEN